MSTDIQISQPAQLQHVPTPNELISQAISQGMSGEQLNGLLDFAVRYKAEAAKEAYFQAFKKFKDSAPKIVKDAAISHNGKLISMYAKLEQVCNKLIPALGAVNITHRWDSEVNGALITVTCYLRHEMGYEEKGASMTAAPDQSGAKNAVQAVGSTISYLQRYTLLLSCGVAAEGVDTDAQPQTAPEDEMDPNEFEDWKCSLEGAGSVDELKDIYFKAREAAKRDKEATKALAEVKNRVYLSLTKGVKRA